MHYLLLLYLYTENEEAMLDSGLLFILALHLYSNTLRNRNYISTAGLQDPSLTSGQHLYLYGTDSNYLSVMGVDRATFDYIFHHFSRVLRRVVWSWPIGETTQALFQRNRPRLSSAFLCWHNGKQDSL
jgi:hypothetical protein